MTRARIISALILFAVLGVFGAVYQFYLKGKLEMYSRDLRMKDNLETAYAGLNSTFKGYKPEVLTKAWVSQVQPWNEALASRGGFFNVDGMYEQEVYPENGPIMRFWFDETTTKEQQDFYQMVAAKMGRYDLVPQDILGALSIPRVSNMSGLPMTRKMMDKALSRLSFGVNMLELVLNADASRIDGIVVWPQRTANELIKIHSAGLSFTITSQNLVRLLEQLRTSDRFYNVEALKVSWPYIAYPTEPQLQVSMVLSLAKYKERATTAELDGLASGGASTSGVGGATTPMGSAPAFQTPRALFESEGLGSGATGIITPKELSVPAKMWRWFKRNILYTN